jgi:hypothetical protein
MTGQVRIHPNVNHVHFDLVEPGEHIDGCTSGKEVEHHLLRYLRRISAYPFGSNAVIGGEDVDRLVYRAGDVSLTDGEPLRRQIFQTAQTSQRLGERVEASPGLSQESIWRSSDGADHLFEVEYFGIHRTSFRYSSARSMSSG